MSRDFATTSDESGRKIEMVDEKALRGYWVCEKQQDGCRQHDRSMFVIGELRANGHVLVVVGDGV